MTIEQLLNKLIEKGWKPFGRYKEIFRTDYYEYYVAEEHGFGKRQYLRNLVSIESGLWQFVCENGMVDMKKNKRPAYRIKESALTYENELEDFLLQNIKVEG